MESICSKKLNDQLSKKLMTTRDEKLLVYKIIKAYSDFGMEDVLYKVLTGEDYSNPFFFLEAQPYSQRQNEGNSYLDIVMGSVKFRGETESGIEFDEKKEKKEFLCSLFWKWYHPTLLKMIF